LETFQCSKHHYCVVINGGYRNKYRMEWAMYTSPFGSAAAAATAGKSESEEAESSSKKRGSACKSFSLWLDRIDASTH
jgi:hypothetical protein